MPLIRLLFLLLACCRTASAFAASDTGEEELLLHLTQRLAPLALSADGRARVHVDDKRVMHRVLLADPSREQTVAMPLPIWTISASRTAQKVAVITGGYCVGLVDFGADGARPTLRWLEPSFPDAKPAMPPKWVEQVPAACGPEEATGFGGTSWPTLALSPDGRVLATRHQVVDTSTARVVASPRGVPARVRFVDGGKRLLAQSTVSSEHDESYNDGLSEVTLGLWDLSSGALLDLRRRRVDDLDGNVMALDAQAEATWWLDEAWPPARPGNDAPRPRLTLHRTTPGDCGPGADAAVVAIPAGRVRQVVVDPLGRWVALELEPLWPDEAYRFVALSLADGHVIQQWPDFSAPDGLIASPDGTRLFGWSGGAVVELPVALAGLKPAATPAPSTAAPGTCLVDGATAESRQVARKTQALTLAWKRAWPQDDAPKAPVACDRFPSSVSDGHLFLRPDGGLWVDRGATLVQLAPGDGHVLETLATPRKPTVCSVTGPHLAGWFSVQGDTLTLRDLAGTPASRRVIERRPGWDASEIDVVDRAVRVVWRARPGTVKAVDGQSPLDLVMAIYDANGKRIAQNVQAAEGYDFAGDAAENLYGSRFLPACTDAVGRLVGAVDWRPDVFGAFRARACGAAGAPDRTLLWTDTDIRPRADVDRDLSWTRLAFRHDGPLAVAQDDQALRVFDIDARRELGQVPLGSATLRGVTVSARDRLVIVETIESGDSQPTTTRVAAWRIP